MLFLFAVLMILILNILESALQYVSKVIKNKPCLITHTMQKYKYSYTFVCRGVVTSGKNSLSALEVLRQMVNCYVAFQIVYFEWVDLDSVCTLVCHATFGTGCM
jgi:hypothetical protein